MNPTIKIPVNKAGHHYSTSVCIEFEAVYDVAFGIIRTIQKEYNDPSVFNQRWMNYDNYTLRSMLYERSEYNPILAAMINKDKTKADEILLDMYKSARVHKQVLSESPKTSIASFLKQILMLKYGNYGDIVNYIVICKNKTQAEKLDKDFNMKVHSSIDGLDFDVTPYDLIILDRYEDILTYSTHGKPIMGKYIWIPEFTYNMDRVHSDQPDMNISVLIGDINKIYTYEPYNNYKKPVG